MGTVKLQLKNAFIKAHHLAMIMHGASLESAFSFLDTKIYAWQPLTRRVFYALIAYFDRSLTI